MTKSVSSLLAEAEELISTKLASKRVSHDSSAVVKLAAELREGAREPNLTVKIAEAIAIVDTLINLEELVKIAHLEEKAKAAGYTEDQVTEFIEKKASPKFVSVTSMFPWLRG